MTLDQAIPFFVSLPNRLEYELRRAEQETLDQALSLAVRYSSGTESLAQLQKAGHPYARRRGAPGRDPSVINAQSGAFRAAWRAEGPYERGVGRLVCSVLNDDPKTALLAKGTRWMFARPLPERVLFEVAQGRMDRLSRAVEAAFAP